MWHSQTKGRRGRYWMRLIIQLTTWCKYPVDIWCPVCKRDHAPPPCG